MSDYAKVRSQIVYDVKSSCLDNIGVVAYSTAALLLGMTNIEPPRRWNNVFVCTPSYMGYDFDISTDVCDRQRDDYNTLSTVTIDNIKCTSELQTILDILSEANDKGLPDNELAPSGVLVQVLTYYYGKHNGFSKLKLMLDSAQLHILKQYEAEAIEKYNSGVTWRFCDEDTDR